MALKEVADFSLWYHL